MTMSSSEVNLENYLIPMTEIIRATNNFSTKNYIGDGGFGTVYRGQLSKDWHSRTTAIKRLAQDSHQGEPEFRNELDMLSKFHHENIISFIGYCDEGNEKIIVSEYAINGSLDDHLQDVNKRRSITWIKRLQICIGAARGLNYLHWGLGEHNRVIHRDVKSANILLDYNLVPKICDFGLSKWAPKNLPNTHINTKVAGTNFYLDPTYHESHILRKEADVYSFGVILFEMLSGILVYTERSIENDRPEFLMNLVRRYDGSELRKLIDPHIRDQVDSRSFDIFRKIAYQCVSFNLKERPKMDTIIENIEEALKIEGNVSALIDFVMEDFRFSHGKPVAAFTIYKWLLHWKCLEDENSTVFDQIIQKIRSAIKGRYNNNRMAYWLSCTSTLLFLIQKSLKHDGASSLSRPTPTLLHGSMTTGFNASVASVNLVEADQSNVALNVVQVEAKYPALVFKQQLIAYVEKLYCIIRDNLKTWLESLPALCIQAHSRTFSDMIISEKSSGKDSQLNPWQDIVDRLNDVLITLKQNFVPPTIVQNIFVQVFSYINVELFNSLLLFRECCSFRNGEYVKAGLAKLELWCFQAKEEYVGLAWDELTHIRQANAFLVKHEKDKISLIEITNKLCPILSIPQLYRISVNYLDDNCDTHSVSSDVISRMMTQMREDSNFTHYLLNDRSSIPFFLYDLSTSLQVKDFVNLKPSVEPAS